MLGQLSLSSVAIVHVRFEVNLPVKSVYSCDTIGYFWPMRRFLRWVPSTSFMPAQDLIVNIWSTLAAQMSHSTSAWVWNEDVQGPRLPRGTCSARERL